MEAFSAVVNRWARVVFFYYAESILCLLTGQNHSLFILGQGTEDFSSLKVLLVEPGQSLTDNDDQGELVSLSQNL